MSFKQFSSTHKTPAKPADKVVAHYRDAAKAADPAAIVIAEQWGDSSPWLLGDQADSTMDYRFRRAVIALVNGATADPDGSLEALTPSGFANAMLAVREDYPEPAYQQPDFADAEPPSETASNALLGALVTAAVMIEVKGVADRADIDAAWRAATGQTLGPFGILASVGGDSFIAVLDELRAEHLIAAETADAVRSHLRSTG